MKALPGEPTSAAAHANNELPLFERIFRREHPRITRVLGGLLGPDDAPDAAQEVFLKLYHSTVLGQDDARIAAWLYRVAVNTAYNLLRTRRRQSAHLQRVGQLEQADWSNQEERLNPDEQVAASAEAALVQATLATLSDSHRTILVLRHAGLSYAEVAAAAGVKATSVGALLARAEQHFRAAYLHLAQQASPIATAPGRQP